MKSFLMLIVILTVAVGMPMDGNANTIQKTSTEMALLLDTEELEVERVNVYLYEMHDMLNIYAISGYEVSQPEKEDRPPDMNSKKFAFKQKDESNKTFRKPRDGLSCNLN